jgi:hypothetical protein
MVGSRVRPKGVREHSTHLGEDQIQAVTSVRKMASIEVGFVPLALSTVSVGVSVASWATQLISLIVDLAASAGTPFAVTRAMIS